MQEEQYGENSEVTMATVEALASLNLEMGETENTFGYLERILTTKTVQLVKITQKSQWFWKMSHIYTVYVGIHDMARTFYMKAKTAREGSSRRRTRLPSLCTVSSPSSKSASEISIRLEKCMIRWLEG